jgi:hypothetical protein
MAIRFVQPGRISDVVEGVQRLLPYQIDENRLKKTIAHRLLQFRQDELVCLYAGQRYMLLPGGEAIVEAAGLRSDIDERRMFLLKETRRANPPRRGDAHEGSL